MTSESRTEKKNYIASAVWITLAFLTAAAALVFALAPIGHETRVLGLRGNPGDAASGFFNALCLREWRTAAWYVRGEPELGLDRTPEDELEAEIWNAFLRSWSWQAGEGERIDKLHAAQTVYFTCLSQKKLMEGVNDEIRDLLAIRVDQTEDLREVYTEEGDFRDDVVHQALSQTVEQRLEKPEKYMVSVPVTVHLTYQDNRWQVEPEESLWQVLSGRGEGEDAPTD